jgi:hypothetical protein
MVPKSGAFIHSIFLMIGQLEALYPDYPSHNACFPTGHEMDFS